MDKMIFLYVHRAVSQEIDEGYQFAIATSRISNQIINFLVLIIDLLTPTIQYTDM